MAPQHLGPEGSLDLRNEGSIPASMTPFILRTSGFLRTSCWVAVTGSPRTSCGVIHGGIC